MSPVVDRPIALSTGEMGNDAKDKESFFDQCGEANRFTIHEIIGKGSYGVVCSATDIAALVEERLLVPRVVAHLARRKRDMSDPDTRTPKARGF